MRNTVKLILRYLHGIITVITAMTLMSYPASLFGTDYQVLFRASFSVLIPFMVSAIASEKTKNIFVYLFISLASLAAPILLSPDVAGKVFFTFSSIVIIILRIVDRVNHEMGILTLPRLGMIVYFAGAYLLTVGIGLDTSSLVLRLTFIYLILLMVFENLYRLDNYLEINQEITNIPKKQIFRTNNLLLLVFVILSGLVMFLFPKLGVDQLIRNFLIAMRDLFWAMLQKIPKRAVKETVETTMETIVTETQGGDLSDLFVDETPPAWLTAIYNGITAVFFIITGAIALFFLTKAVFRIIRHFYRSFSENGDEEEFIPEKTDERAGAFEASFLKKPEWLDFSPNASIRRFYRRTVEKQSVKVTSRSMTPREIEDYVGLSEDESRTLLHELYERARYSAKGCDKEDLKKLRGKA